MKRKLLIAILFFFPTFIFASESNNFNQSKTVIIESTQNYVILENKSALIETKNVAGGIDFNRKFGDEAASECQRQGNNTWFKSTDKRSGDVDREYFKVLSKHKGKFLCLSEKVKVSKILNSYLSWQSGNCVSITKSNEEICNLVSDWIGEYKFRLKELEVDSVADNLNSIVQKQQTCKTLGFEVGTPPNGECVLKLMELETKVASSTQTIINNNAGSDDATVNALVESQKQMLIQQQSQSLMNLGSAILNSGQPKINCRQTLTGFSCY